MSEDDIDIEIDKAIAKDDAKKFRLNLPQITPNITQEQRDNIYWTQNIGSKFLTSVKFNVNNGGDLFDEYYLKFSSDKSTN